MKAILKEDMIMRLSIDKGVEVGNIPRGVPLDRLRWNGSKLVDLIAPQPMYVRYLGSNFFELHIVPLPNCYPVYMSHRQRKDLRYNAETKRIGLATSEVKAEEQIEAQLKTLKGKLKTSFGDQTDLTLKHLALTAALIVYASEQPQALKNFFDDIADDIKEGFPLNNWESILKSFAKDIKQYLIQYYNLT